MGRSYTSSPPMRFHGMKQDSFSYLLTEINYSFRGITVFILPMRGGGRGLF
jgi:hypothetical protein